MFKVSTIREEMDKYIRTLVQAKTQLSAAVKSKFETTTDIENSIEVSQQEKTERS